MFQFLESIKLKDGEFLRLKYHQQRVDKAFQLFAPNAHVLDLEACLSSLTLPGQGVYKCRVIYGSIKHQVELIPYQLRPVQTLKLIETNIASTVYKPSERSEIEALFSLRGECDDVLLIKDGLLTDSSYCNIALYNGQEWISPRVPLVYGTQRAELIERQRIIEQDIPAESIQHYQQIRLFNAMIEFGELAIDLKGSNAISY